MGSEKLGLFLREVSNWGWDEFVKAEKDKSYTSNEAIIFALIRACAMQKMEAIRVALNRLDGKLKTPVRIEYPKIYYIYPNAAAVEGSTGLVASKPQSKKLTAISPGDMAYELAPSEPPDPEPEPDLPSLSLRQTLTKMADYPRELPEAITNLALQAEQWIKKQAPKPAEIPKVKSVVAAHLLTMAQNRNIDALTEVFDQIDGKLAETLQIVGEDIFITSYAITAPPGAYLNAAGVLQLEADKVQDMWAAKLGAGT